MTTTDRRPILPTACARAVTALCALSLMAPAPLWAQAPGQASPAVPAPPDITPRNRDEVVLNFVNADLEAVVRAVGQATGKNFVIDPRVKGTVNLVTEAPVSRAQALDKPSHVRSVAFIWNAPPVPIRPVRS